MTAGQLPSIVRTAASTPFLAAVALAFAGCASEPADVPADAGPLDAGPPDAGPMTGGGTVAPFTLGVSTLAGSAQPGYVDGARADAMFANPVNVAYRAGVVYVADFDGDRLRAIDAVTHVTTTVVSQTGFRRPFGLAFAADGTFYVSTDDDPAGAHSSMTGTVWKVDLATKTAAPVAASIGRPRGIVALPDGRLAATDYQHHVVEVIDPTTGMVTIVAGAWDAPGFADGDGATARFSTPYGLAVRADGLLVVADYGNHAIRLVALDGTTATLAGGTPGFADGPLATARFDRPQGVSMSSSGDLYVSDSDNFRVRRIAGTAVETVAGSGQSGHLDHDDPLAAKLYGLEGLSVVPDGSRLYVADGSRGEAYPYNRIRQVELD